MREDEALERTLSEDELARTLELRSEGLVAVAETALRSPNSTIEPAPHPSSGAGRRALEALDGAHAPSIGRGLDVGATLGEGGMGVVRTATQRSLGRKVAVKTLRPNATNEQATLRLLREGWVTGALEHPNIVPVHDLGLDADGAPIIVLKQIEGRPWSQLIADREAMSASLGPGDRLEQHLRILLQLCNAVSFAHSRGILHRDLKPENVMIGHFGEVYLVDWGIAVSLRDDPSGRLPLASDAKEMAGTPSYMAPEMLGGGKLDERTDVYLLGAILHEILVGRPPHGGNSFHEIVVSILKSSPALDDVPPELAAIVRRAMSPKADDRFPSAEALRQRIEWFLRHRGSLALSTAAALRVDELRALLAAGGESSALRERVHHLFAEARFGFRQAILASDDNEVARAGLREVTEMVVAFELDEGMPEAARAALAELDAPPPELVARVTEAMRLREREKARMAKLERLSEQLDPATGRRTRFVAALMLAFLWTVAPEICGWVVGTHPQLPAWAPYGVTLAIMIIAFAVGRWGRESLSKTVINRRLRAATMVMFATQLALQAGGVLLRMPIEQLVVLHLFVWFYASAAAMVLVTRALWPATFGFLLTFLAACIAPRHVWHFMAASNLILMINLVVSWAHVREDMGFMLDRIRERRRRPR